MKKGALLTRRPLYQNKLCEECSDFYVLDVETHRCQRRSFIEIEYAAIQMLSNAFIYLAMSITPANKIEPTIKPSPNRTATIGVFR
tara:strand:- start:170 stop:427 length:258 start_codon:yes stop_codon:yes gene_type:complete